MGGRWLERKNNWLDKKGSEEPRPVGRPLNESEDYGVKFIPLKCPKCRSKEVRCYKSAPPVRYHICRNCGYNFKSVEVNDEK